MQTLPTNYDFSYSIDWVVKITPPEDIKSDLPLSLAEKLDFYLIGLSLPSTHPEALQYNLKTKVKKYVIKNTFDTDDFTLEFRCDAYDDNYMFFLLWQSLTTTEENDIIYSNYADDYLGKIEIDIPHNQSRDVIYNMLFKDVFPIHVSDIRLGSEDIAIKTFSVTFTFSEKKNKSN